MMADGSPWWADEGDGVKPDWGELPASEKEASSGPVGVPDSWDEEAGLPARCGCMICGIRRRL